jgi:hypothetical protein
VIEVADSEPMDGDGRALPHNGFSALQPGRSRKASAMNDSVHGRERACLLAWNAELQVARFVEDTD